MMTQLALANNLLLPMYSLQKNYDYTNQLKTNKLLGKYNQKYTLHICVIETDVKERFSKKSLAISNLYFQNKINSY